MRLSSASSPALAKKDRSGTPQLDNLLDYISMHAHGMHECIAELWNPKIRIISAKRRRRRVQFSAECGAVALLKYTTSTQNSPEDLSPWKNRSVPKSERGGVLYPSFHFSLFSFSSFLAAIYVLYPTDIDDFIIVLSIEGRVQGKIYNFICLLRR